MLAAGAEDYNLFKTYNILFSHITNIPNTSKVFRSQVFFVCYAS